MTQFANEFTFDEIVHQAGAKFPWRTIIEIMSKFKSHKEMLFYINETHTKEKSFDTTVSKLFFSNGTPLGTRTPDPLIKSQLLYQLS